MAEDAPLFYSLTAGAMLMVMLGDYAVLVLLAVGATEIAWKYLRTPDRRRDK